jgi:DNA-binding XRE family transcriptional regulator
MDEHGKQPNPRYLDGDKLRAARIAAALEPAELAALVGIDRNHVYHHERGSFGCHMRLLRRYAEALGIEPKDLMLDSALAGPQAGKAAAPATEQSAKAA